MKISKPPKTTIEKYVEAIDTALAYRANYDEETTDALQEPRNCFRACNEGMMEIQVRPVMPWEKAKSDIRRIYNVSESTFIEIKPCPLCGGKANISTHFAGFGTAHFVEIICMNCHMTVSAESSESLHKMPEVGYPDTMPTHSAIINALDKWNKRTNEV